MELKSFKLKKLPAKSSGKQQIFKENVGLVLTSIPVKSSPINFYFKLAATNSTIYDMLQELLSLNIYKFKCFNIASEWKSLEFKLCCRHV